MRRLALIAGLFGAAALIIFAASQREWAVDELGAGTVPGTGAVVGEDRATSANPSDVWGGQDSAVSKGTRPMARTTPTSFAALATETRSLRSGNPTRPRCTAATSPRPASSRSGIGPQGSGKSTRTQTQAISRRDQNEMAFTPGKYVFYLSFRLQSPSLSPDTIEEGGASGNANHSQLFQFKSFGGSAELHLLNHRSAGTSAATASGSPTTIPSMTASSSEQFHVIPGQWVRMAIVADWDREGWYEVWADVDENGNSTNGVMQPSDQPPGRRRRTRLPRR